MSYNQQPTVTVEEFAKDFLEVSVNLGGVEKVVIIHVCPARSGGKQDVFVYQSVLGRVYEAEYDPQRCSGDQSWTVERVGP